MNIIDDEDYEYEEQEVVHQEPSCPRCVGGCGYCLMLER
jgi:hypothetical protein